MEQAAVYNKLGRMLYNPEYHKNTGEPWTMDDLSYLISWYDKIGPTEMAFALERTETSVMQKVNSLRKEGVMVTPMKRNWHKR